MQGGVGCGASVIGRAERDEQPASRRVSRLARLFAVILAGLLLTGCGTVDYLSQSIGGHLAMLRAAKPVDIWIADPSTPPALRDRLVLSQRMRDFAIADLDLPDNPSYRRYADLKRPSVIWNVVAAPELSLTLEQWCFPVVGCVGYRGYFDKARADELATELKAQGFEVSVYGVPAYSTLGKLPGTWFADPLLNTFIRYPEGELARMIFHELAHQVVYAKDDTLFNESFATSVERLGGERWLHRPGEEAALAEYQRYEGRRRDFRELTVTYRDRLKALYESDAPDADKRERKAALFADLRRDYETFKTQRWAGYIGYDPWFANANNASLGVQSAYNELVPGFERVFAAQGSDFARFYREVARLAALPKDERRAALR
ncbi:MAG: putative zinc protease protein [Rhizobacter sp.]|nr:putative zinc protease protein [Rhizobacter sp.]